MGWASTYEKIRYRRYENKARIPDECQPQANVGQIVHAADYSEAAIPSRLSVGAFRFLSTLFSWRSLELPGDGSMVGS
jgi:hypothetical protein